MLCMVVVKFLSYQKAKKKSRRFASLENHLLPFNLSDKTLIGPNSMCKINNVTTKDDSFMTTANPLASTARSPPLSINSPSATMMHWKLLITASIEVHRESQRMFDQSFKFVSAKNQMRSYCFEAYVNMCLPRFSFFWASRNRSLVTPDIVK
jgi:hypothetical protein